MKRLYFYISTTYQNLLLPFGGRRFLYIIENQRLVWHTIRRWSGFPTDPVKKIANAEGIAYLRGLKLSYHGKEINNNQKLA